MQSGTVTKSNLESKPGIVRLAFFHADLAESGTPIEL